MSISVENVPKLSTATPLAITLKDIFAAVFLDILVIPDLKTAL